MHLLLSSTTIIHFHLQKQSSWDGLSVCVCAVSGAYVCELCIFQ